MNSAPTSWETPAKEFARGIGQAVAERTVARIKESGERETWAEVAYRVAVGNAMLRPEDSGFEFEALHKHLRQASVLMSGRHLQHGDADQPTRPLEVFANCATSASTFILFYLLLAGSGVGRSYDDDMMLVDWSKNLPYVISVIREDHPDVLSGEIGDEFVNPKFPQELDPTVAYMGSRVLEVLDSREGWAKALEEIECLTWEGEHADKVLLLDFSHVRCRGTPIKGMQNRPASGPAPLMGAIKQIAALKGSGMAPWLATMHADHYSSECVRVGGARRAARMATKTWRDSSVFEFINVKKDGGLWSSNNSVTVDGEFWSLVKLPLPRIDQASMKDALHFHAHLVFEAICKLSYGNGEPGIINVDRLTTKDEGIEVLFDGNYAESERFSLNNATKAMTAQLASVFAAKKFKMITNPCGEIVISMVGGYCTLGAVVPYHSVSDDDAEEAFRVTTRALIRVNTMNSLYEKEVTRTNRIGVGLTGLHEYAWSRFGFAWKDLLDEQKSMTFWKMLSRFSNAVVDEALHYSSKLGLNAPHTALTTPPGGTISKLFGLCEGIHLPSMREYLRWVQFRFDDPLVEIYRAKGYPVRENLKTYKDTTIVGFPTVPQICSLGLGDKLVTASEATPEEQYEFLRLMEKYWIDGYREGIGRHSFGGQNSFTLKYKPKVLGYEEFRSTLLEGQSTVKCCSVMLEGDTSGYEYLPEECLSAEAFAAVVAGIHDDGDVVEDIGIEHIGCESGSCPIDFNEERKAA